MKKRIGLFTWLGDGNYGTALQSYALYRTIELLGHDVYVLSHRSPRRELKRLLSGGLSPQGRLIRRFQKANMKISVAYSGRSLRRHNRNTDVYVCGGDQMWNTCHCFNPFNFLSFAGDTRRVSYAVSIGAVRFAEESINEVKRLLQPFHSLMLREKSGADAVSELTGRQDVHAVLDPCFLPGRSFWDETADASAIITPDRYILCYILGKDDCNAVMKDISDRTGISELVVIPSTENPDIRLDGASVYSSAGLEDFIKLVRSASLVVTDSFHGTVMSIIMERDFVELRRFADSDNASQNTRIYELLENMDLAGRFYGSKEWQAPCSYVPVRAKLEELRRTSLKELSKALDA